MVTVMLNHGRVLTVAVTPSILVYCCCSLQGHRDAHQQHALGERQVARAFLHHESKFKENSVLIDNHHKKVQVDYQGRSQQLIVYSNFQYEDVQSTVNILFSANFHQSF
ncbi:hypothetical protein CHARACLAT_033683 [Characodon lateralis]|uniref:Secreted protein n=1 Tax=Characodon lateralis TaxID=208331 RepID=A0ABU7CVE4_9TELE|nr:hypothetical protein [Characodon lateralis]